MSIRRLKGDPKVHRVDLLPLAPCEPADFADKDTLVHGTTRRYRNFTGLTFFVKTTFIRARVDSDGKLGRLLNAGR